jgi:hypothetical protein
MRVAPASRAFSTSSLMALAGAFDHLAGGDTVDGLGRKAADGM